MFYPYLTYDTVFDNSRALAEVGPPATFSSYCSDLLTFARQHRFAYPFQEYPASPCGETASGEGAEDREPLEELSSVDAHQEAPS